MRRRSWLTVLPARPSRRHCARLSGSFCTICEKCSDSRQIAAIAANSHWIAANGHQRHLEAIRILLRAYRPYLPESVFGHEMWPVLVASAVEFLLTKHAFSWICSLAFRCFNPFICPFTTLCHSHGYRWKSCPNQLKTIFMFWFASLTGTRRVPCGFLSLFLFIVLWPANSRTYCNAA